MKMKWLIILFAVFAGVILLSLLITQLNNNTTLLPNEETPQSRSAADYTQAQSLPVKMVPAARSLVKSGITIIKTPERELENKIPHAQAEKSLETVANASIETNSNSATQRDTPAGITKTGKHPTPKESREMNSAGIVMY